MALFCSVCGNSMTADDKFCRVCGRIASADSAVPTSSGAPGIEKTSGKAIASLVCGLLFFIPFLFVAAVVFGHMALSEIRKSGGRLKGEGLAIAGLVFELHVACGSSHCSDHRSDRDPKPAAGADGSE